MKPEVESLKRVVSPRALAGDRLIVCLLTLGLYALLMQDYPIIYGGDTVIRLVNFPRIFLGHELPLLQVLTHFTIRWFYGPVGIFALMAFISAAASAGIHALTWQITRDRRAAWAAAIFYMAHPFILYYSRVPYQEPLLVATLAWGFYYLFRPASASNSLLSSLFFGLACFSRFEGWIAAFVAALFHIRQAGLREGRTTFLSVARSFALFCWAPAVWILWHRDLSPAGSYVLDLGLEWGRLYRPYFVMKSTLWWTESAVVVIAVAGFVVASLDTEIRQRGQTHALLGLLSLLLAALVFSGHGIEPDPMRLVTEREAFVPIGLLMVYAGIGMAWLSGECGRQLGDRPLLRTGIPALIMLVAAGYGLHRGVHRMAESNADPELRTDYEVARYLAREQANGLVLAAPLPARELESFVESAAKWGGSKGREGAQRLLTEVETTPLDFQRVLAFSWMGKERVFSSDRLRGRSPADIGRFLQDKQVRHIVVFSDFRPAADHERIIMDLFVDRQLPKLEIRNGNKAARIYPVRF
jgi:hypothetical protein